MRMCSKSVKKWLKSVKTRVTTVITHAALETSLRVPSFPDEEGVYRRRPTADYRRHRHALLAGGDAAPGRPQDDPHAGVPGEGLR